VDVDVKLQTAAGYDLRLDTTHQIHSLLSILPARPSPTCSTSSSPWSVPAISLMFASKFMLFTSPTPSPNVLRIASSIGSQVLSSRGVIRGLSNWGQFDLPRPTTKHQNQNFQGHYFVMQFDSSVSVQDTIKRQLRLDPRMIRFSVVRIGDKLGGKKGSLEKADGKISWGSGNEDVGSSLLSAVSGMMR
jgi:small subunit ribosomal protein S6